MPPTPSRGSQRPDRSSRQGSSVRPTPHLYQPGGAGGGGRRVPIGGGGGGGSGSVVGPLGSSSLAATGPSQKVPFIHPALVASSSSSNANTTLSTSATHALAGSRGRKAFNHRNLFAKDLRNLMYAYGDVANPDPESVTMLEEMTVEFITDLCARARPSPYALGLGTSNLSASTSASAHSTTTTTIGGEQDGTTDESTDVHGTGATLPPRAPHRQRVKLEDFRHVLRKEVEDKKLARFEQLLYADRIVTEARKVGGVEEVAEKAGALNATDPQQGTANANGAALGATVGEDEEHHQGGTAKGAKVKGIGGKSGGGGAAKGKGGGGGEGGGGGAKAKTPAGGAATGRGASKARVDSAATPGAISA